MAMSMTTVQDIERAIAELTPEQRESLLSRLDESFPLPIDLQLAEDLDAGRLDGLIERAIFEDDAGETRSL